MSYLYRQAEEKVHSYAEFFKVVAILGARQVGKSSLLKHLYPHYKYITFDPVQDLYGARKDPDLFLQNFKPPLILDEIQYVPELIPAIKRFADQNETPGQYFITGSQNISVLKNISESLAGRVGIVKLSSMTGAELNSLAEKKESWLSYMLTHKKMPEQIKLFAPDNPLPRFLWRGTMPGIIEAPDEIVPSYFESYVLTYIERDVRLIEDIKNLSDFSRFVRVCAALTAQEINSAHLGREIGITPQTARRWLDLLIQTFQWIELEPYTGNTLKRISGKKKGYFADTGLASYLQRISSHDALFGTPFLGALFETGVVTNLLKTLSFLPSPPSVYHWRTSAGAEVDFVIESNNHLLPIEIKAKSNLNKNDARGLSAFFETYPHCGKFGIIIYAGKELYQVKENIWAVPWNAV